MKAVNIIILVLLSLSLPVMGIGILFGLAGSNSEHFVIISIGYIVGLIFSIVTIFRPKYIYGSFSGVALILLGFTLNDNFWSNQNKGLCADLRAEPTCVESKTGFNCTDFNGANFYTGIGVCNK